jgi:hypothetical protein
VQIAAASLSTPASSKGVRIRVRPAARALGIHPVLGGLIALQAVALLFDVASFWWTGLRFVPVQGAAAVAGLAAIFGMWGYFVTYPGRNPKEWVIGETFLVFALFLQLGALLGPAQYGGAALNRPYVDSALAAADAAVGVNVSVLSEWSRQHPMLVNVLVKAYFTLLPQFFLPFVLLGFVYRDRRALWEYVTLLHLAALVTVVCFVLWPAACAPQFYGVDPVGIDQSRVYRHLAGLRSGTMTTVSAGDLDGLVSVPSFHVLGAMCVTWAFRRRRWILAALLTVNVLLAAATVLTGVHYLVDVVAAFVIFPCMVWLYRRLEHFIEPDGRPA